VDPIYIEETDDWLGCPTPLETCRHQLAIYENEFEELNLQLRQARERIFKLVEMHAGASAECETLRSQLSAAKSEAADARRRATDIETKSTWELMAKNKHISELVTKLEAATGISVRTGQQIR
jgi:chromosome segregation ATPase